MEEMRITIHLKCGDVLVRPLAPPDSIEELTELLHRAYAALARQGFRYVASHQDSQTTRERIQNNICLVGLLQGKIVATICYHSPQQTKGCPWYDRSDVASFGQFGVASDLQGHGLGSRLMELVEQRASTDGAAELALDTAEGATHLILFYEKRGYRSIGHAQWTVTNYRSVILSKRMV